jgi:hypothetical protein
VEAILQAAAPHVPLDEYKRRRDLELRMQALAGQEELLHNDAQRQQQLAGVAASLEAFRGRVQHGLANATFEQRRQLVLLLIDRVIVTDAEVEISYVLPTSSESEHVRFCQLPQYCSMAYQAELKKPGIRTLMSGKGNCFDNAVFESFFKTLKSELVWRICPGVARQFL